jgi:hypothetical protein
MGYTCGGLNQVPCAVNFTTRLNGIEGLSWVSVMKKSRARTAGPGSGSPVP